jgi:hypothetical protein
MKETKLLIFSILCVSFPAAFVFGQTPPFQAAFIVERESSSIRFVRKRSLRRFSLATLRIFPCPPATTTGERTAAAAYRAEV